ncbi:MAG: FliA/WhiG family RNA polymerase sigma factor [Oscillospiraceae bacterium]|nr:FliA/WhiG family RNA polymerase sigma factor [Oscillospiraceae bacterium]
MNGISENTESKMTDEEVAVLHEQYKQSGDIKLRNALVMNYSYIAKTAAMQLRGLAQGYAQIEDMVSHGMMTLIDCIDKYDASKGMKFESYAFMRIRGSVIDLVRKQDWIPRRVRTAAKEISDARSELCTELRREPTEEELAKKLGISVEKLRQYNYEVAGSVTFSFEELIQNVNQMGSLLESATNDYGTPEKHLMKTELRNVLKSAIEELNDRERLVVTLYYFENLNLSEIAEVLEVSVQRVSQISSKAVSKIRKKMSEYMDS